VIDEGGIEALNQKGKIMRAIKNAKVSFGLVSIDVKVYKATETNGTGLHLYHEADGGSVKQKRVCSICGEELLKEQIVRGQTIDGSTVTITDDEVKSIRPEKSAAIKIREFVSAHEISSVYFNGHYYLGADKKGETKAFFLLREALRQCGRIAIGTMTFKEREHVVCIEPFESGFLLSTLNYESEVRDISEVAADEVSISDEELKLARQIIDQATVTELDLSKYIDSFAFDLSKLLETKAQGKVYSPAAPEIVEPQGQTLVDVLKASVCAVEA